MSDSAVRKFLTFLLVVVLLVACAFTAWQWWRPYDRTASDQVPYRITEVSVQRDQSYSWINLTLSDDSHVAENQPPPVKMICDSMDPLEAGDYRYFPKEHTFILRFWIENKHLGKELQLQFTEGNLLVKKTGEITMQDQETRIFAHPQW